MRRLPPLPHKPYPTAEEYRVLSQPKPGWWMVRWRRDGPEMPAAIVEMRHEPGNPENILDTGPILVANIGFEEVDPIRLWEMKGRPIGEAEYRFQMARVAWVLEHAGYEPEASPRRSVDLGAVAPIGPDE